ncbi:glycoside hydrolase family 3 C-terminal domain-containing protein [candidate division KSB1 bacterium]|nr:glycoside hydrolase family 3 C-terminal domain-containing protein [candidate division KSB1 bacterium]
MNQPILSLLMSCLMLFLFSFSNPSRSQTKNLDEKVTDLLSRMTLEEKVGQMTQISLEIVAKEGLKPEDRVELNMQKLRQAILKYHVGSILNVGTSAHPVDHWQKIITTIQDVATGETRLKIPIIYGIDAIHGASYTKDATLFPQSIGMAATWNPELMKKNGEITAYEVRASGIPWNFNPVLDIGRQPLWSRLWETFGEDPYLAATLGTAYVKGQEGEDNNINAKDKVATCLKHYLGYSFPLTGKDRTPSWIPDRMLREYFVPTFQAAIQAGARTVMVNSSEINGIPVHSSYFYLTELLRNELGFKGFVVSDWYDIKNLHEREKVAASQKEAVKMAVMAGIDMSMVPLDYSFYDLLLELINAGEVPAARIDEAVGRILKIKLELGLFENPYPDKSLQKRFACKEFEAVNLQAAQESITLLKNDKQILPLAKDKKVLVTGPTANMLSYLNGGWTITWQGDREDLYPKNKLTILQAIEKKIGKENVIFEPGVTVDNEVNISTAVEAAQKVDAAIVCIGEKTYCETPGNIVDLTLPEAQLKLVSEIKHTGKPVILVLVQGRPRIIREIVEKADGILMAYLPGIEGGRAIADVVFGDFNPGGKLPITYPRYPNDLTLYDHKYSENTNPDSRYNPQFPFGFGLSYTRFEYSRLTVAKKEFEKGETLNVSVQVKNIGDRAGKEVVQLYLSDLYASVTPSVKKLKRFEKVALEPGETKTLNFILHETDLSFIGRDNKPVVEPGEFEVMIGGLKEKFLLR